MQPDVIQPDIQPTFHLELTVWEENILFETIPNYAFRYNIADYEMSGQDKKNYHTI